jgi:hypothetical protein
MKKLPMMILTLLFLGTIFGVNLNAAPKSFEGVVTYKITYPGNTMPESQMAMFPKVMTISIKGDKSRTELQTPMGSQVTITDYTQKSKVALINMMGQKYAIKETPESIEEEISKEPVPEVEQTGEEKTIAGYLCKKAIVKVEQNGKTETFEVWYTEAFGAMNPNFDNPIYKDIKGVMLEFTIVQPQISMKFSAISVDKQRVSSKDFEVPSDYTYTTMEELQSKMGGM